MPKVLSDELLLDTANLFVVHGTTYKAAKASGVSLSTFEYRLKKATDRGFVDLPKPLPLGQLLKGTSTLYKDGEQVLQWVKTSKDSTAEDVKEALVAVFDSYKGRSELVPPPRVSDKDLLSVYPIADQHIGLLAWGKETGEAYDLDIGAERLRSCAKRLVAQSPDSELGIVLNLGDWQHSDDGRNETPQSGNQLDVDGRYFKVLQTGVRLMIEVVELALAKHEKVLVRNLPGNHDPHASIALTVALGAFFHNNKRVVVDDDPSEFFFHRFGETLMGANHGHRMKPADMAMLLAARRKEDWGATKYKHFFFGHIHHFTAKEVAGVLVESFQTLAAKDAWSHSKGFNSGQSLVSITFDKTRGEIGRHKVNV